MALSKAELQAVVDMASLIPATLQDEVHIAFTAGFTVNLLSTVIALKDDNEQLMVEKEAAVAQVAEIRGQMEPLPESLPIQEDGEGL